MVEQNLSEQLFDDDNDNIIDPFELFEEWYQEVQNAQIDYPNALTFATVDKYGMPDARILLMNGRDNRGFVVYMNLKSAKGQQLTNNPKVAALFYWKELRKQVRIRGYVEQISDKQADAYFATRPRGSCIGAHASHQSRPLASRNELLKRTQKFEKQFPNIVPRPKYWSGYRIIPLEMEFWKDGKYRLHDRILFKRENIDANWKTTRLNP